MQLINTQAQVESLLPVLMAKEYWGYDSETTGLDPHKDKVTLVQIGDTEEQYVIDVRKVNIEPLRPFLEDKSRRKIGHHIKFDYKMMKTSHGIELECVRDTMLAEKIYHNGRRKFGFGLDDVLENRMHVTLDKTLQKSFIGHTGDFSPAQLQYAGDDVKYLVPLAKMQANDLQRDGQLATWQMECEVTACFGDMELYGVKIEQEGWKKLILQNQAKADEIKAKMDPHAAPFFRQDLFGNLEINYASPAQILQLLQHKRIMVEDIRNGETVKELIKDTKDPTLLKLQQYPLVKLIQDYRGYMMRVTHFGQAFLDAVHPVTGRIHPLFDQLGTETGRPASHKKSPVNMLNIPKEKEMRNCFVARDEDHMIQTDDYSGCELRIWAYLSQDPFLLEAFLKGLDVHCYVATKLYGREVTKKDPLRSAVKSLNFGIAYGMGPKKLYDKVNGEGTKISYSDSKQLYKNYETEVRTGVTYLRQCGKLASEQGWLANLAGRRRYWVLPDPQDRQKYPAGLEDKTYLGRIGAIQREGGNCVIQSVNAEMTKRAMIGLRNYKKQRGIFLEILNNVYDELVTESKKEDAEEVAAAKKKIMIEAARPFLSGRAGMTDVPMDVEGHCLPYWTK